MGTRADFYVVEKDGSAEWLGSIAWDGYPSETMAGILEAKKGKHFRAEVASLLAENDDATLPEHGWPWPWETSKTTDFTYVFDKREHVTGVYCFGDGPLVLDEDYRQIEDGPDGEPALLETEYPFSFPSMKAIQNVALGPRSGLIVIGGKR